MARPWQGGAAAAEVVEQLERHFLAPDASLLTKTAFQDLNQAREEMARERTRYLEALAVYGEAVAMVEEYQQAAAFGGGTRALNCPPEVYETLEHRLAVAEATQRLRLPLLSKEGDVPEDIEKLSAVSRSSFDSTMTSVTLASSSLSSNYNNNYASSVGSSLSFGPSAGTSEVGEPGVGGVANCFLGITPNYLYQVQQEQTEMTMDPADYQQTVVREVEARLETKCDMLSDIFSANDIESSSISQISSARLPERVKLVIEGIEKEEALLLDDLSSMDRKFAEHYHVLEQVLAVLVKFVKDLKLQHQHQYDDLKKTWLCKRCHTISAKLSVLEHLLLRDTYTKDSVAALHKIRKYLLEATEEASIAYSKAVTRLREYQGVDPHFDTIARQYHDIVKKLEGMQWTISQVEMDLKNTVHQQMP